MSSYKSDFCRKGHDKRVVGRYNGNRCKKCLQANDKKYWFFSRLRKRGLTIDDYNTMFAKNSGCCHICNKHISEFKQGFSLDHNHSSGEVRGLLCRYCNLGLGNFKDNKDSLKRAIEYLTRTTFSK